MEAGLAIHPRRADFDAWVRYAEPPASLIALDGRTAAPIDLSRPPAEEVDPSTLLGLSELVAARQREGGADVGFGGYLERRAFYDTPVFADGHGRQRSVHLGLDLWSPAGEAVFAPLDGIVVGARYHAGARDYGAVIVVRHEITRAPGGQLPFYSLYGHLSRESLAQLAVGRFVAAGSVLAHTGTPADNGGWPPHLHFQVFLDDLGHEGDFPGVCFADEVDLWAGLCPDPWPLAGLPQSTRA